LEYVQASINNASRAAYTELLGSERQESAIGFTARAVEWFARHGVTVERTMTDNGSAHKSFAFRDLLAERNTKHKPTLPYKPRSNGRAESFIQTSLREWANAQPFRAHSTGRRRCGLAYRLQHYVAALGARRPVAADPAGSAQGVAGEHINRHIRTTSLHWYGRGQASAATTAGGLGLTPAIPAQAQLAIGGDNVRGNDSSACRAG
jgi:hypothetical protein